MKVVILVVYANDIVVTRSDVDEIHLLKVFLKKEFEMDLGLLKYFLGTEVARSKTRIVISQKNYTLDLLAETRKLGTKSAHSIGAKAKPLQQQWRVASR